MKLASIYSSRTGNTRRLAEGIAREFSGYEVKMFSAAEAARLPEADAYLVGYWADRGHANEESEEVIKRLAGKTVGVFGTLGAYPYGEHARHVLAAVEEIVPDGCNFIGSFLCQGPVDPAILEKFQSLPAENPHALTPEAKVRHAVAAGHPNALDAQYAAALFQERLERL